MINGYSNEITSGEARKISFVRALLRKPSLLILDEAFSFMDEADISKALNLIPNNIITLFISHFTSVMENAGRIYELRDGILDEVK